MDTSQTPPTGGQSSAPAAHPHTLSAFNKTFLAELDETDKVVRAAQKPEYATKLAAKYKISGEFVTSLATRSAAARTLLSTAKTGRDTAHSATDHKTDDEHALIAAIHAIQTGAHLQYDGDAANLARYFVGTALQQNEAQLKQIAGTLLKNLESETLPGVDDEEITALQTALAAWLADENTQNDSGTGAGTDYAGAVETMKEIKRDKRRIQIAANGLLPYTNPVNAAARGDFELPAHRPFV